MTSSKGVYIFFNILDVKYDPSVDTPVSFYNKYRTIIVNNLAKVGDVVKYKNEELTEDEKMSPMLEDVILLNVLREINPNLPKIVRSHYNHKMQPDDKMMDFKSDMLNNIPSFLQQADIEENNAFGSANLGAFRQQPQKKNTRRPFSRQFSKFYCRMCFLEKLPKEIFTSHNFGDKMCKSISKQDKLNFESNKLSNIKDTSESGENEDELAEMFGYCNSNLQDDSEQEVDRLTNNKNLDINCRHPKADMNFIRPVASQILTVFENPDDTVPLHIDLDSGATLNYCEEDQVKSRGFKMYPNTQMSKLGDGVTSIQAVGEIHEYFFRNNKKLQFNAVVCKRLNSPFIGGTLFLKENNIEQDFLRNVIHLDGRKTTIQPTDPMSILPTRPIISNIQVKQEIPASQITFKRRTLLPGQCEEFSVNHKNGTILAIEPHEKNNNPKWPTPQL